MREQALRQYSTSCMRGCMGAATVPWQATSQLLFLAEYFLGELHILAVHYIMRHCDPEINAQSAAPFGASLSINRSAVFHNTRATEQGMFYDCLPLREGCNINKMINDSVQKSVYKINVLYPSKYNILKYRLWNRIGYCVMFNSEDGAVFI